MNDLIDEAVACKGEISRVEENSIANVDSFAERQIVSGNGTAVDHDYVFKKIGELVDSGNLVLQMFQSVDPDVTEPATLTAIATLMSAIKGCISEYTKIHSQSIKFQQTKELEELKKNNRMELMQFKKNLYSSDQNAGQEEILHEIGSNDLIEFLQWKKEKEEMQKAKEGLIVENVSKNAENS